MDLRITQKPAVIGLEIRDPQMSVHQKSAELQLENARPGIKIKYPTDRLEIDYTQCNESIGYYEASPFSRKAAEDGQNAALSGIAKIVEEGNMIEDIHTNGFVIPYLANRDAWVGRGEVGLGFKPAPFIQYETDELAVTPQNKDVQLSVNLGQVNVHAIPGDVSVYLQQNPEFDIEFIGNNLDTFR